MFFVLLLFLIQNVLMHIRNLGMVLLNKNDTVGARDAFLHAVDLLQGTEYQKQIPVIKRYIEQIDRHETIKTRAAVNYSPRYRSLSKI